MATTTLSRTFTSGDPDKWTFSTWLKKSELGSGSTDANFIFCGYADASNYSSLYFDTDETLHFYNRASGGAAGQQVTSALFRDTAAWYHLVCVWDSGNASSTDRMKLYVNGEEVTAFAVDNAPTQDLDSSANVSGNTCYLGTQSGSNMYFNGVLAHSHFCDGQAYAASDFGETDSTSGIWVAKTSPSVTYGTNGFFLKYQDTAAFGDDSSGNTNDFTMTGTMTQTKDTPDNNFCTMNPLYNFRQAATFSNGNNTVVTANNTPTLATMGLQAGKWYWEAQAVTSSSGGSDYIVGLVSMFQTVSNTELGNYNKDWGYVAAGSYRNDNTNTAYGDSYTTGDYIGIAFDLDNMKLYFSKNGVWQNSGDPAAGTNGISMTEDTSSNPVPWMQAYFPAVCGDSNGQNYTWSTNFGNGYFGTTSAGASNADDAGIGIFKYDVPAGFYAICTNNLQSYGG